MMRGPPSVSRRLLIAVALPLLLFFVLTASAIDYVFREQSTAALRDRLEEQVVALITAVDLDFEGKLVVNLLDPESRLDVPGSGQYAALRDESGGVRPRWPVRISCSAANCPSVEWIFVINSRVTALPSRS